MVTWVKVKCPYCGQEQQVRVDDLSVGRHQLRIRYCEVEAGGCDRAFVIDTTVSVSVEVKVIRATSPSLGGQAQ